MRPSEVQQLVLNFLATFSLVVTLQNNNRHTSARAQNFFPYVTWGPWAYVSPPSRPGDTGGLFTGSEGAWGELELAERVREPGWQTTFGALWVEKLLLAFWWENYSAVHKISASVHKTDAFRWRKLQNGGRFLYVLSVHIIFPTYSAPMHANTFAFNMLQEIPAEYIARCQNKITLFFNTNKVKWDICTHGKRQIDLKQMKVVNINHNFGEQKFKRHCWHSVSKNWCDHPILHPPIVIIQCRKYD